MQPDATSCLVVLGGSMHEADVLAAWASIHYVAAVAQRSDPPSGVRSVR